jgi:hypothetical protein
LILSGQKWFEAPEGLETLEWRRRESNPRFIPDRDVEWNE